MRLIFVVFRYFPFGGLERNFLAIIEQCVKRGHQVTVFTRHWEGEKPADLDIIEIPVSARFNHHRDREFVFQFRNRIQKLAYDLIVGFNKMPGLDVYYAADPCYRAIASKKFWYYRLTPRFQHHVSYEAAVFDAQHNTRIMAVSTRQIPVFKHYYNTSANRFIELPPGIHPNRKAPENREQVRSNWRQHFGFSDKQTVILSVGADFKRKGLKRTLNAVHALPASIRNTVHIVAVGDRNHRPYTTLARKLGLIDQCHMFEGRDDIPAFLSGADILAHPALVENTGNILLEAIIAGLPVIATEVCGYSCYIQQADAGLVIPSPYQQQYYNQLLLNMMAVLPDAVWSDNGIQYGRYANLYDRARVAADFIEATAKQMIVTP